MILALPLAPPLDLPGETNIWSAHLSSISEPDFTALESSLDAAERARAARFRFERDRRHFVAARGILRHLLGDALSVPAETIAFRYGRHGKPALAETDRCGAGAARSLHFNLSHSDGHAMFARSWTSEVGIDLETGARLAGKDHDLSGLAVRVLTPRELAVWRALPDAASRHAAFLRAWTRKEAYGKATGKGVFDGLTHIEVALDAASPQPSLRLSFDGTKAGRGGEHAWVIHDLPAPAGFAAALAVAETPRV